MTNLLIASDDDPDLDIIWLPLTLENTLGHAWITTGSSGLLADNLGQPDFSTLRLMKVDEMLNELDVLR